MGTLLNVLVSLIAAPGTVPYISVTIRGNTKPRIVTWLTWARLTGVAGAASLSAGHLGSAVFAVGTVATSSVVVAGLRNGDRSVTTDGIVRRRRQRPNQGAAQRGRQRHL